MVGTETIIVTILIAIAGVVWLIFPFFQAEEETETAGTQKQLERLLVYYEQVMATLRDLEEDHATGKVTDVDYNSEREAWAARGVKVLDAINQISDVQPDDAPEPARRPVTSRAVHEEQDIDAAIEAAVQKALRAKG